MTTAASGLIGVALGLALATAPPGADGNGRRALAIVLLLALAAALADATTPRQRTEAATLEQLGCPRWSIRAVAWAAAVAAIGLPAAVAAQASAWAGAAEPTAGGSWLTALVLSGLGAATTCGTRLAEVADPHPVARARLLGRLGLGAALVLVGAALPSLVSTGSGLDLALPFGLLLAISGLVVLAPIAGLVVAPVLAVVPAASPRIAGSSLRRQRRGLTISVALVATVVLLLVVQGVVGQGLGARERARVAAVRSLGPATVGGGDRAVVLDRAWPSQQLEEAQPTSTAALAEAAGPGAIVAKVPLLQAAALPPGGTLGDATRSTGFLSSTVDGQVALATPDLVAALGLDPALANEDRALVLDDRFLRADGTVHLVSPATSGPTDRRSTGVHHPAIDAVPGRVWAGVPGVLLPRAAVTALDLGTGIDGQIVSNPGAIDTSSVVRFPARPTEAQVDALTSATMEAVRGDRRIDLTDQNRSDRAGSIWVRTDGELRDLARAMVLLALAGLTVALASLRLAVRGDDAVLVELGARRRSLVAVSAWRGFGLAIGGTVVGLTVGLAATAVGVWHYDQRSRVQVEVVLAPIGWHVPTLVWPAVLLVPILAALVGAALAALAPLPAAGRRRLPDA